MRYIIDEFINSTVNVQIGDMRLLPVPIPTEKEKQEIVDLVEEAIEIQKGEMNGTLEDIKARIDEKVKDVYGIDVEYEAN